MCLGSQYRNNAAFILLETRNLYEPFFGAHLDRVLINSLEEQVQ